MRRVYVRTHGCIYIYYIDIYTLLLYEFKPNDEQDTRKAREAKSGDYTTHDNHGNDGPKYTIGVP